ncbi:MAG: GNAT family N-acetyltransferase [Janthinobacterium lividum]
MARASVEVREAGVADVDALMWLYSSACLDQGQLRASADHVRARLVKALAGDTVRALLAVLGDQPVGYALLTSSPLLPLGNCAGPSIEHLHVVPEHRRRGVGRALMRRALLIAQADGAEQLACTVLPDDREYTRYMARLGFAPVVVRRAVSLTALRRRLAADHAGVGPATLHTTDLVARRRSLRARLARVGVDTAPVPETLTSPGHAVPVVPSAS